MLKITKETSISDLERWIVMDDHEFELEVLESFKYDPGFLIALIQFFLTKLRLSSMVSVKTNIERADFSKVLTRPYDFNHLATPLLFSDDFTIRDKDNKEVSRGDLIKVFQRSLKIQEYLYSQDFNREILGATEFKKAELEHFRKRFFSTKSPSKIENGVSFLVGCFDHLEEYDLHKNYYLYSGEYVRYSKGIASWLSRLFKFGGFSISKELNLNSLIDDLSVVIHELFQNTEEWGKTNFNNTQFYSPNFRAVLINLFLDQNLNKETSGYEPVVNTYLFNLLKSNPGELKTPNKQGALFEGNLWGVCEVSVFDTGPGMARRWTGKDFDQLSEGQEIDSTIKCFNKYITSDTSGRRHVRGRGLSRVISIISGTGLIRVRTGNICIYRDFFQRPLKACEVEGNGIKFNSLEALQRQEGTSITILYPFIYSR
ncbi:hypothetical protein C900_01157 [Fulvivirga imtechensis AK7]|uniref:Uncharacterized protein n=2 Tax=Fulvivirga TaxID=396811 RepID=L8JII8_9BACT|nr:hypothetical protein C900_01157 [Fulvivirga imtechensis AK7]